MGAGWDQVRSRGPQFRSESGVDRIIRYLGGGALPAVLETVAVAVHLQDVNVVGEPVKQSAGEPLGAEHVGPLVEGQVGGDQDGAPFVALAEDLEEEFRTGGGEGDEAQLVDDEKPGPTNMPGSTTNATDSKPHSGSTPRRGPRKCQTSPTFGTGAKTNQHDPPTTSGYMPGESGDQSTPTTGGGTTNQPSTSKAVTLPSQQCGSKG